MPTFAAVYAKVSYAQEVSEASVLNGQKVPIGLDQTWTSRWDDAVGSISTATCPGCGEFCA